MVGTVPWKGYKRMSLYDMKHHIPNQQNFLWCRCLWCMQVSFVLPFTSGSFILRICRIWIVEDRIFYISKDGYAKNENSKVRQSTVEGFLILTFILMNPRNFRIIQESCTTWVSGTCLDIFLYRALISSLKGSTHGCGAPWVSPIFMRRGSNTALTCSKQDVLTLSVMWSGKRTLPVWRKCSLIAWYWSQVEWSPSMSSFGLPPMLSEDMAT